MVMRVTAQLGGIYPRSEELIELTRSFDRGKTDRASVEKQFEQDTIALVRLQENENFETFSDGSFYWQDQLRPTVEALNGITTGTRYDRWFDTNTFYKKPIVTGKIRVGPIDANNFIRSRLLTKAREWKVSLIGPYTFSELSENLHYKDRSEFLSDLAAAQREIISALKSIGVSRFQISEPSLVCRPYREDEPGEKELDSALSALRKTVDGLQVDITIQTYFGDATNILPSLLKLPVETIGFDVFETDYSHFNIQTPKKIALGIVDSRESNVEDAHWIAETASRASKHVSSNSTILVPNSDLKFVPRKVADAKARALAEAAKLSGEAQ